MSGVPKTIRKVKENAYANVSYRWIFIFIIWIGMTIVLLTPLLLFNAGVVVQYSAVACMVVIWTIYIKWFRNSEILDRTILVWKYIVRGATKQTLIPKYDAPVEFLKSIVPLETVHSSGLIEFTGQMYGLLLRADPPRLSEDDLASHGKRVEHVINSLHGDLMLKTIACSKTDTSDTLASGILASAEGKTEKQKDHLYQMYRELDEEKLPVIDWQFYIFVGFGKHDTPKHAEITRQSHMPGLLKYLNRAGVRCTTIERTGDIALVYRQMLTQRRLFG